MLHSSEVAPLEIEIVPGTPEGIRVMRLRGAFTLTSAPNFQVLLLRDADKNIILDLTEVPYMDSAALRSVIMLHVSCLKSNRRYALAGVAPRIDSLFAVAGLQKILVSYPTAEEALKALQSSTP